MERSDDDLSNKVESVQRRAARWVTRDYRYTSCVSAMIRDLNWRILDQRRIDSRLVLLYKVTYDLVAIPASDYLIRNTRLSSRIHPLAYWQITTLKDYYKYTYFPRTSIHWNALPHHIPILPTLAQFCTAVCQAVHSVPKIPATVLSFDTSPHELLKSKLFSYGIGGKTLKWINAFLCYRQQRVVVNGVKSDWAPVVSGVPQRTVLGPLLFSLHINGITADIESEIRLFADDCVCYREIKDKEDTLKLQRDINRLGNWARKWGMKFKPVKCNMMQLTRKHI